MKIVNQDPNALQRTRSPESERDWLEKAGFLTHSQVRVEVGPGKIIIELIKEPDDGHPGHVVQREQ